MKRIFLVIILFLFCSIITGCSSSNNGYESITVESELCSYFFEYSSYYNLDGPRTYLDTIIPATYLDLVAPRIDETAEIPNFDTGEIETVIGHRSPAGISINVCDPNQYESAPQTAQERIKVTLEGEASWANFKLLNRSPLTVSGVQGELIEYLVDRLMPIPREDGKNLDYVCAVYFDYNGLLWMIEAKCIQELKEQVKADFDYIVQSFKIIR
jgi:hypothetical protein